MNEKCPHCGSENTERIVITAQSEAYAIWIMECNNCDEWFNSTIEKETEDQSK